APRLAFDIPPPELEYLPRKPHNTDRRDDMKQPCVYILCNRPNGTLYIGVTSNLPQRVWQHKNDLVEGFTRRYRVHRLVYFEMLDEMYTAITREKQLKNWKRQWKVSLIERRNPDWRDLYQDIL